MLLQENIPLAPLTTFRIGGPARFFVEAKSRAEVQEAVAFSRSRNRPLSLLGGGSNLLVSDSGFPGLVLKIAIPGIEQRPGTNDEGKVLFEVGGRRVPERHSWKRGRHAGTERGRLRSGSLADDRVGRSLRPEGWPGARIVPRGL